MLEERAAEETQALVEQDVQRPALPTPSDSQSLTDASTIDDSAIATPYPLTDDGQSSKRKRKAAPTSFQLDMPLVDEAGLAASPYGSDNSTSPTKVKRKVFLGQKKSAPIKRLKLSMPHQEPVGS